MKLIEKFHDSEYHDPSLVKHPSNLNLRCQNDELSTIIARINATEPTAVRTEDNLNSSERAALLELKSANDVVIKKADKGNTLVIMDTEFYRDKIVISDHLNTDTYSIAPQNADKKVYCVRRTVRGRLWGGWNHGKDSHSHGDVQQHPST